MARPPNDRIIGVLLVGLGLFGVLWTRCVWLQLLASRRYTPFAASQQQATQPLRAHRGAVLDRTGRLLAISIPVPSVFANARQVADKQQAAKRLADVMDRSPRMIERQLARDKGFVWVARQVDLTLRPSLVELQEPGVGVLEESKRFYPHGKLLSNALGFVDIDERGLEGLELSLNGILQGQSGWRATLRDAKGDLLIGPWTIETPAVDGYDAVLTIDGVVQQVAEEILEWGAQKYHAKGGSITVMDPATGAILAMADYPSYDPNVPARSPVENRRNRAVTDVFEPGSIFKVVTASALLNEGRIAPEEPIFCENGSYHTIGKHTLHDHESHGTLPFRDVIKLSSNIGTAKAAQRLKPEELYRYIRAFGFGRRSGIDAPGEVSGMINPPARWSKLSPFIIPIGQEVAVTPIQLAVMTAVIANGGYRVRPHLIDRLQASDGRLIRTFRPEEPVRIITPETARTMQTILTSVVESGTGQLANVQGLTVAGKTGTAQKIEPTGRYSHSRFVASFVGFGPVPDARFVIVVSMDEPRPLYFGGVVSAPMFRRIVEQLSSYWELKRTVTVAALP